MITSIYKLQVNSKYSTLSHIHTTSSAIGNNPMMCRLAKLVLLCALVTFVHMPDVTGLGLDCTQDFPMWDTVNGYILSPCRCPPCSLESICDYKRCKCMPLF